MLQKGGIKYIGYDWSQVVPKALTLVKIPVVARGPVSQFKNPENR